MCNNGDLYQLVDTKEIDSRKRIKYQVVRTCRLLNDYSESIMIL